MRRWDNLVDGYIEECKSRGICEETFLSNRRELERCGNWLKRRRPKPVIEAIDGEVIIDYISMRSAFKANSTVYSIVSHLRCMGEHIVNSRS